MKLVLVADAFPPMRTSAAVQLRDLSRGLVRQGHELTVLLPCDELKEHWDLSEHHGTRVLRLAAPKTKDVGYMRRTIGECMMPHAMRCNLKRSPLASERWEGVIWYSPSIFHGPLVRDLKLQGGCRSYLIIRDIFPEWALDLGLMRPGPAYQFFKAIARQQYAVADAIGVQSPGNLGYFETWLQEMPRRQLEVLPNWLSPPATDKCSIRIDATPLAGRKIFVYAGNMGVAQGLDILVNLAEQMTDRADVGFLFVGRGSEADRLKAVGEQRGLDNVLFYPEIDPDQIPDLYSQCSAGIVALDPRHKSHNIPGKFLTYIQNGLPVLANVNQGNDLARLIRETDVGEVCEANDITELEHKARVLLARLEGDAGIRGRCRSLFQRDFSVAQTVQQIVSALQRA